MTTRRGFVRLIGGGGIAAATGILLAGCDGMPGSAVAPWAGPAPQETDPRRRAASFALLAPNPHNLQSWLIDLRQPDELRLHVDRARLLPATDPFGRQILIGQGTFLELLSIAAAADGYATDIDYFPDGVFAADALDARPVARVRFRRQPGIAVDPLHAQIVHRRSNKEPYENRPLDPGHAAALAAVHDARQARLDLVTAADRTARLRDITRDAMMIEMKTLRTLKESIDLTRIGADEIAASPDGIDLHGPMFWWLKRLGLMTPEKAMTPGTMAYQGGIDYALGWANATHAFGMLATPDNSRMSQVTAGRAYVRLNLKATELGVAMHPVSQVLQEYPEMAALQAEFRREAGLAGAETVQMLFRLGYAAPVDPSPRRRVDALLMTGSA